MVRRRAIWLSLGWAVLALASTTAQEAARPPSPLAASQAVHDRLETITKEVLLAKVGSQQVSEALREVKEQVDRSTAEVDDLARQIEATEGQLTSLQAPEAAAPEQAQQAWDNQRRVLTKQLGDLKDVRQQSQENVTQAQDLAAGLQEKLDRVQVGERLDAIREEALGEESTIEVGDLRDRVDEVTELRQQTAEAIETTAEKSKAVEEILAALGPATEGEQEPEEVVERREEAKREQARSELVSGVLKVNLLKADELLNDLQSKLQSEAARELLQRHPSIIGVVQANLEHPSVWLDLSRKLVTVGAGVESWTWGLLGLAGVTLLVCLLVGYYVRGHLRRWAEGVQVDSFGDQLLRGILAAAAHHAPVFAILGSIAAFTGMIGATIAKQPLGTSVSYGLLLLVVLRVMIRSLLAPFPPAQPFSPIDNRLEKVLARRMVVLALLAVLGLVLAKTGNDLDPPAQVVLLVRAVMISLLCINLGWLLWLDRQIPQLARRARWLRPSVVLLLGLTLVAELTGYRNLSTYLLNGVVGTILFVPAWWIAQRLSHDVLGALRTGRAPWAARLREWINIEPYRTFPGIPWLQFVLGLGIWTATALVLLRLWASEAGFTSLLGFFGRGFGFGGLTIVPSKVVTGLALFGLLMTLNKWFGEALKQRLSTRTHMDQGARVATVTLVGYLGFCIALLVAFNAIGVDMTKLAVLAGALSVGIGFGLQNIVDNFVSGLILLFERPIKVGDYIIVGGSEGYVRRMSVRSTELQTLDREEVIVPNSTLLSEQVINRTRYDPVLRIKSPVGVAYGSDVELVMKLLMEVGMGHDEVIKEGDRKPVVLFRGFGDSSLDFELRCMVRHMDKRFAVESDLNVAIDKAFREHAIEIPFPQRDLHLRSGFEPLQPEAEEGEE